MPKEPVSAKVEPELAKRLESRKDIHGITMTENVQQLLWKGLRAEGDTATDGGQAATPSTATRFLEMGTTAAWTVVGIAALLAWSGVGFLRPALVWGALMVAVAFLVIYAGARYLGSASRDG